MQHFLAAVVAVATSSLSQLAVENDVVEVHAVPTVERCYDNRLLGDPTSSRVAVWEGQRDLRDAVRPAWPTGLTVAHFPPDGASRGVGLRLARIHGPMRVDPLRWSLTDNKLLLRVGKSGAALFDPAARQLALAPDFDPLWTWMAIETMRHGDIGFYRRPYNLALARRIREEGPFIRWLATVGEDSMTFLVSRDGERMRLTAYEGGARWKTGIPLPFATAPLLPPGTKRLTFLGDQSGFATFLPYAMPLIDRQNGRIIGRFGLERIELSAGRKLDLEPHFKQLMAIQDASANGDTIFALVDLEREKRIVRIRGRQVRSWHLCEKKALQVGKRTFPHDNALPAGVGVKRTLIRFEAGGRREGAPFALLYRPRRADGRLVVYFHGGPTASLAERTIPFVVSHFAPEGVSVLAVEQSGMNGGGLALSERLPKLGFEALRQDVAAVTRWVRRSGYGRAFLIGDSFGGASGVIAATEHPPAYEHIFLRVPYLKVRTAKEDARPLFFGNGAVPPERQQEFFETIIGGGREGHARFAAALRASVSRLKPSQRLSFYFATLDTASKPGDLPAAFAGHPSVTMINGMHEIAPASSWDDILVKMGSGTPAPRAAFGNGKP